MEVLTNKFPGRICICSNCGALMANIQESDIYSDNIVYCPLCKTGNYIEYSKSYDGVVKEEVKEENDTNK